MPALSCRLSKFFFFALLKASVGFAQVPKTVEEFREICRANIALSPPAVYLKANVGEVIYAPIRSLNPGQVRFCFSRMLRNLEDLIGTHKDFTLRHHNGTSAYAEKDHLTGVLHNGQVYLVDGHHHLLAGIMTKTQTMPVKIIEDWTGLPSNLLASRLQQEGFSYPFDMNGQIQAIPELCDLINDPYLDLARGLMLKAKVKRVGQRKRVKSLKGTTLPALIKINDDLSFLELLVADALRRERFLPVDFKNLTEREVTTANKILKRAAKHSRLNQVLILKSVERLTAHQAKRKILRFLKRPSTCAKFLSET